MSWERWSERGWCSEQSIPGKQEKVERLWDGSTAALFKREQGSQPSLSRMGKATAQQMKSEGK